MSEYIVVPRERAGLELDEFLCLLFPEFNKGFVRRQVRGGLVLVDGEPALPSQHLRADQVLILELDDMRAEAPAPPVAPRVEIPVLYEDEDVLVVDKPAGLAVEPERWAKDRACVSGALRQLARERSAPAEAPDAPLDLRLRLVHRIDKDTSGALIVAKHLEAERGLRRAFEAGGVEKRYLALVEGEHPLGDAESEEIDLALGADDRRSGLQVVRPDGKASRTRLRVEERFRGFTLLECRPLTGRTHQIRVHLAAAGFPLVVDPLYGRRDALRLSEIKSGYRAKRGRVERPLIARLTLHARRVAFPSAGGGLATVEAPLPKDLTLTLKQLRKVRRWTA